MLWLLLLWSAVSRCTGFSSCGLQALEGLSICATRAYLLHSIWDLSGPVTELLLPALQSRLLATEPPGKPYLQIFLTFPGGSDSKASVYNAGDLGSIPGSGRFLGKGNGNPSGTLARKSHGQRSLVQATVHGVAELDMTECLHFHYALLCVKWASQVALEVKESTCR